MNNEVKKEKVRRNLFGVILVLSFLAIYIYNILTPLLSDDLLFDKSLYHSFWDIIKQEYWQYMNWNGRSVLQILLKIFTLLPKGIFNFFNSLCYVITVMLIYWNVGGQKKNDCFLLVLIQLCIWNFAVDFDQTILWLAGACNYLWGIMIILGFITLYRYFLKHHHQLTYKKWLPAILFVPGVLAGWGNENTSGGAILIVLLLTGVYFLENKKIEGWMISSIGSMCLGFLFLVLAPGNKNRMEIAGLEESYTGLAAYVSRGLKVLKSIDEYLFIYIAVICFLGAYFYYKKQHTLWELKETAIFALAALATAGVLILTVEPMPRAYFGANIYMMTAALMMVQKLREEDTLLLTLKTGGIIAAAIAMCFVYVEEGANLARIYREVNEREAYIREVKASGHNSMTLPMLRPEFESKYSMAHLCDISQDPGNWNNEIFRNVYLINRLTVLPRDEWEEYIKTQN